MTTAVVPQRSKQLQLVLDVMEDGHHRTLVAIQAAVWNAKDGLWIMTQSISARLRDLRKPQFGGFLVEKRRLEGVLFEYRVDVHAKNPVFANSVCQSLRVVTVTNNVIANPEYAAANIEFPDLVSCVRHEVATFVVDTSPDGSIWRAEEFFDRVQVDKFFVDPSVSL